MLLDATETHHLVNTGKMVLALSFDVLDKNNLGQVKHLHIHSNLQR